jgi:carbon-monoxide dehydrogenase medium subunit
MYHVVGYHRPGSVDEAVRLLGSRPRIVLGGGVHVQHRNGGDPAELVDLQAVGLDSIRIEGSTARIGATARLQTLVDDDRLPAVVRDTARAEHPSTLRWSATIGGTVARAAGDSMLLAALLAHDAVVRIAHATRGERTIPLAGLLDGGCDSSELIVEVAISTSGRGASAGTGRTPRDIPIVGVVGRRVDDGADGIRLGVCGVGLRPLVVRPDELDSLRPVDDHRATSRYRRHVVDVLAGRVLEDLA